MDLDAHYTDPSLTAIYDSESGWSVDREYYLALAGPAPLRILDIGCGTGLLASAYAMQGHDVTGVDPAEPMLDIARQRTGGETVTWVNTTAASFGAAEPYDLITMTGHAFQVFMDDTATIEALSNIARHLAPGGRFVFETRNPAIDWASKWQGRQQMAHEDTILQMSRTIDGQGADWIAFTTTYALPDGPRQSKSKLRMPNKSHVDWLLDQAGLQAVRCDCDWTGNPFRDRDEQEMIFHCTPKI